MNNETVDPMDDALTQYTPAQVAMTPGLYAIEHLSHWCGEDDLVTSLARLDDKGDWTFDESGKPVLEFHGDVVVRAWPLDGRSAIVPYDSLTAAQRLHVLNQELQGQPLRAWSVYWDHVVAARSKREALEAFIAHMGDRFREEWNIKLADVCEIAGYELEKRLKKPEKVESFQAVFDRAEMVGYLGQSDR